ncbi:hypothetical protein ACUHMQ_19585 [Chitinimonas sp. PSY-7]|uniref:hypothetical protein n=1 Tax=Chitinimonas sp. PSY-7 TaxID=3459088 RepID=UPI0040401AEF
MRLPPLPPLADPQSGTPQPAEPHTDPPLTNGFETWFVHALTDQTQLDPTLAHGPADFGLWGVTPDADGRLDLDEIAANLRATLPAFATNLGNVCRVAGISVPPLLRLESGSDSQTNTLDVRTAVIQQLFSEWPGLARQFRRLTAGFGFTRCGDALRAYQRAIGRLGPNRLANTLVQQDDNHASPHLSLLFDGLQVWPEEAYGDRWRPLAGLDQLSQELLESAVLQPVRAWAKPVPIEQAFDLANVRLRTAKVR